jgi:hypothetical protein
MQTPEQRAATARANRAKSRGPITPTGKARSGLNALRHGLTSDAIVVGAESAADFESLLTAYLDHLNPTSALETELITTMAIARWRLRRAASLETRMLTNEMRAHRDDIRRYLTNADEDHKLAWTFQHMGSSGINMLLRYEATLTRTHDRALRQLQLLREQAKITKRTRHSSSLAPSK